MKRMKRLVIVVLALAMVFALAACGKETTETYTMEREKYGIKFKHTRVFTAKGDRVKKVDETIVVDTSSFNVAEREQVNTVYGQLVEKYKSIDGVECTGEFSGDAYTIKISINVSGDTIRELASEDLLNVDGATGKISLKRTGERLLEEGYTKE